MKKNKMLYISKDNTTILKKTLKKAGYYIVEIPGNEIHNEKEFLTFMEQSFKLPDSAGWDSYADWMTDLDWIASRHICIVINDYKRFLEFDTKSKKVAMSIFKADILPFWEREVLDTMVGGKTKSFMVYMVV